MLNVLILGGTTEASALAAALAARGLAATLSYAGRTSDPAPQPLPVRIGGFGGADGLATYLAHHHVTHLVDATHPFAARISANAVAAAAEAGVPLLALVRSPWTAEPGDRWTGVADIDEAVAALAGPAMAVMLAIGRQHVAAFAAMPQHLYLLRFVDPPAAPPPLPRYRLVIDRGPFTIAGDEALLRGHGIGLVVAKNAGGAGAAAKLAAARSLGLPVVMIDRPAVPPRREATSIGEVLRWLDHDADLGV